jgi:signal transduction histidine kinase
MTANRAAQSGLREGEARYRSLADELEGRVAERTLELKQEIAEREVIQHHLINAKLLAEESNRTKSIFLANMSHELRTPLNAILGYSELLEEDAGDRRDHSAVADLQRVQKAGRHLLTIINDVLDLSKIESGRMDLHCEDVSIARVVEDVAATIHPLAKQQNNTFTTFMADAETVVHVDIVRFRQCLLNLLSNACKFTENGKISLDILADHVPEGRSTRWIVKDTGIGIGTNDLSRLFQAFSQVDSSATRRHDGTGLGLAISRRLINMMGGEITVETERGRGSTFTILLPDARSARAASRGQRAASGVNHERG